MDICAVDIASRTSQRQVRSQAGRGGLDAGGIVAGALCLCVGRSRVIDVG